MKTEKSCDNCIYSIPDWTNVCNSDHYCSNEESEEYGYNAEYLNGCDEWKSTEPNLGNTGSICTKTGRNDEDRTTSDTIYRQDAIDVVNHAIDCGWDCDIIHELNDLPSAQTEIIHCCDCIYYDPEHIEKNGVRYEYKYMPKDAFDILGTGLVSVEHGVNVGGRCCRDYNAGYSEDKRVYVSEQNYCGRAERRHDE